MTTIMPIVRFWIAVISVCCVALGSPLVEAASNSSITIAVPEEPAPFDTCAVGTIAASRILLNNVADAITAYVPETNAVVPSLATSWKQVSPTAWEFNLRSGVRFSDGTPFNAAAAVTSIKRTFNHALNCSVASQIFAGEQVLPEALGSTRLRLTTSRPDPILPLRATFLAISAPSTEPDRNTEHPIGTGAYKVDNWAHGTSVTLVPNPYFRGPRPKITRATYVFRPEARVRVDMVNTGEADMALSLLVDRKSATAELQSAYTVRGDDVGSSAP
jgi:peptide/nickel transport system substrate-binding protein